MAFNLNYITGNPRTKEHWVKRGLGFIFDFIIILAIYYVIYLTVMAVYLMNRPRSIIEIITGPVIPFGTLLGLAVAATFIAIIIIVILFWIMESRMGWTIGKKIANLDVVSLDGPITLKKSILRNGSKYGGVLLGGFAAAFSSLMGVGVVALLIIVFLILDIFLGLGKTSDPRQKFSDTIAGTTVRRTDVTENPEDLKYIPSAAPAPAAETSAAAEGTGVSVSTPEPEPDGKPPLTEEQKEIVKKYVEVLEISEDRAVNLMNAGYKRLEDFKDAIVDDLVLVERINPTVARSIIKKVDAALGEKADKE